MLSCWLKLVSVGFENLVSALNLAKRRLCRLAVQLSVLYCTVSVYDEVDEMDEEA